MELDCLSQPEADNKSRILWNVCDTTPFTSSIGAKCLLITDASKFVGMANSEEISDYSSVLLLILSGREMDISELAAINFLSNKKNISVKTQEFDMIRVNSDTDVFKLCNVNLKGRIIFGIASHNVSKTVLDNCNALSNGVFIFKSKGH
jgi:hypothetical protein